MTMCVAIGVATLAYIAWQLIARGRESSRMANVLASESRLLTPPPAAVLVTRKVVWEPGYARVFEYYNGPLSAKAVENYYAVRLPAMGWVMSQHNNSDVVYRRDDREFRLSFGSPDSGWLFVTSLLWSSQPDDKRSRSSR
jgi:hypothetical protein